MFLWLGPRLCCSYVMLQFTVLLYGGQLRVSIWLRLFCCDTFCVGAGAALPPVEADSNRIDAPCISP